MVTRYLAFLGGIFLGFLAFLVALWGMEKWMWGWPA